MQNSSAMEDISEHFEITRKRNDLRPVEYPQLMWDLLQANFPAAILKTVQDYLTYEARDIKSHKTTIGIGAEVIRPEVKQSFTSLIPKPSTLSIGQHGYLNVIISLFTHLYRRHLC